MAAGAPYVLFGAAAVLLSVSSVEQTIPISVFFLFLFWLLLVWLSQYGTGGSNEQIFCNSWKLTRFFYAISLWMILSAKRYRCDSANLANKPYNFEHFWMTRQKPKRYSNLDNKPEIHLLDLVKQKYIYIYR